MLGGTNPALRTFYYRLLRLISLSIHPLFVFDGPNKPPFKRNKRTGPNVASIPEFLAKQLLKQFGLPFHLAPGEAEAECALLQREGIVDAVLSEDVDTLMFGSGVTIRNWSPEASKSKVPTHVNLYDAKKTKASSNLDREGMILVALMSGGDYVPEGIPGCGPKTACEAARAGFGADLCKISRRDRDGLKAWRDRLTHELHSNESKFFKQKHGKLAIPDDFPDPEILGYYTHPVLSSQEKVDRLRRSLVWDQDIEFNQLREFAGDAFSWDKLGGAKKFIRNLAPALLVRELRMRGERIARLGDNTSTATAIASESILIRSIHGTRNHATTDGVAELRIAFIPHELIPIDLDAEEPDDEINHDGSDEEEEAPVATQEPGSPSKKRAQNCYDPTEIEKLWVFDAYTRAGAPSQVKEWEEAQQRKGVLAAAKTAGREERAKKALPKKTKSKDMPVGALHRFTKVTKPGVSDAAARTLNLPCSASQSKTTVMGGQGLRAAPTAAARMQCEMVNLTSSPEPARARPYCTATQISSSKPDFLPTSSAPQRRMAATDVQRPKAVSAAAARMQCEMLDLTSSPELARPKSYCTATQSSSSKPDFLPPTVNKRRRSPLRRAQTDTAIFTSTMKDLGHSTPRANRQSTLAFSPCDLPSPSQLFPVLKRAKIPDMTMPLSQHESIAKLNHEPVKPREEITITSSPIRQSQLSDYFTPRRRQAQRERLDVLSVVAEASQPVASDLECLDLTGSPTPKPAWQPRKMGKPIERTLAFEAVQSQSMEGPEKKQTKVSFRSKEGVNKTRLASTKTSFFRLRDSLPGAFAIEQLDLSEEVGSARTGIGKSEDTGRKNWIQCRDVDVLDLTGV